ncbi:MAG TPA: TerB family tellurite resistance protein [Polyangiaceae bacterium]|nr:TerB family tellurite resistance protein [Polyangiaceae bacterium]
MSPSEKNIVKSLIAVAWADGRMEASETQVIEGLLSGFDATPEEEEELLEYARTRRTLEDDIPLEELSPEDRELLFSNAALLIHADGSEAASERWVLARLGEILSLSPQVMAEVLGSVQRGGGGNND